MDLIYLFRVLLKRKWIILLSAIIASGLVYFLTRNQPKKYRSGARISTGYTVSDEIKVNKESYNFYEADTKFNNAIVTLSSPSVTSLVSYMLILHDLEDSTNKFKILSDDQINSDLYKKVDRKEAKILFSKKLENMAMLTSYKPEEKKMLEYLNLYGYNYKTIGNNLNIYRVERTDYIQIDYVSENPELSAFVANNIFTQFLRYYSLVRNDKSQESIDTLKSLVEKKKQELDLKRRMVGGDAAIGLDLQGSSKLDLISNLEQVLTDEKGRQITLFSSLKKVEQKLAAIGSGNPIRNNNNNDELIALRKAKNQAYQEYLNSGSSDNELLEKYDRLNNEYQKKFQSTSPIGNQKEEESEKSKTQLINQRNDLKIDIEASYGNIQLVQSKINSLKGSVSSDASRSIITETLLKDIDLAEKEYITAKEKYNAATDVNFSSVNNFRQVYLAQPAIEPEHSKRLILIAMGGFAAMITTILVIILLTYLDTSVKTPGIFNKSVNLKLISLVNQTNLQKKNIVEIIGKREINKDPDAQRHNVFRESIRKLRFEIEKTGKQIFLFTSTKKGMGKTTLIQALSYGLSLSHKKILIIDTNFSNNDLTVQLSANPDLEKTDYSAFDEKALIAKVKKHASVSQYSDNIYVIGSEGGDYTPSEIFPKNNLLKNLHILKNEFDYIFLEGPPLNDFSDSRELAQYAEKIIAVFSASHSMKLIDKESIKFYNELGDKFCGAILNKVDLQNINVT